MKTIELLETSIWSHKPPEIGIPLEERICIFLQQILSNEIGTIEIGNNYFRLSFRAVYNHLKN